MGLASLRAVVNFLFSVPTIEPSVGVVWHAGEPLAAPRSFYEAAFAEFARLESRGVQCRHHFQSNGTLIDDDWCTFFLRHDMRIGLSIDGPQAMHDRHRKDRRGRGTFERTMRGAARLRDHNVPFSVICVLTLAALDAPEQFCDFIETWGITNIGFNVEEIEGAHTGSTLLAPDAAAKYAGFFRALYKFSQDHPDLRIREFADARAILIGGSDAPILNSENTIGSILSFDAEGRVSTYSPELLTAFPTEMYSSFTWASSHSDDFTTFRNNLEHSRVFRDLQEGIAACARTCDYFQICGGGAPSNRLAELGSLSGTETMCCRLRVKTLTNVVLAELENEIGPQA